jgi:hypothetical protein
VASRVAAESTAGVRTVEDEDSHVAEIGELQQIVKWWEEGESEKPFLNKKQLDVDILSM